MKKIVLLAGLLFFYTVNGMADIDDWTTYTNSGDIRDSALSGDIMWCATNGGLLAMDVATMQIEKYTNIDGLAEIDLAVVAVDRDGYVWVGYQDGILQRVDPANWQFEEVVDYEGLSINQLYTYGDSLFIAMDIGISLFDMGNWEVKETWKIGAVNELVIHDNIIWAATNTGVKTAELDFPNLIAPSAWTTFTTTESLPSNTVLSIFANDEYITAGTQDGVAFYRNQVWESDNDEMSWYGLDEWNGNLIGAANKGVYLYTNGAGWSKIGMNIYDTQTLLVDHTGRIWLGCEDDGFYHYHENEGSWQHLVPDGPYNNNFSAVAVDPDGRVWCSSSTGGISMFNGEHWTHYSSANGTLNSRDYRDVKVDHQGRIWCAGYGGGVAVFTPIGGDEFDITLLYTDRLSGSAGNDDYVATTYLKLDDQSNMWILNYAADSNNPVAVVDSTLNRWQYFSVADGIASKNLVSMDFDQYGRLWVASNDMGIYVLDIEDTPFDKSDDHLAGTLKTVDGLASNIVNSIAFDYDEVFYIGTPEGLNTYFGGQVSEYLDTRVVNSSINTVVVDGVNNKWVGTGGGLSMLHSDGFDTTHYVTTNSMLVSDNVTSLAFNQDTGDLYIATSNGMSKLQTPFKKPAATLDLVKGYPNPFVMDGPAPRFYIDNLGSNSQVTIYTAEGYLVKRLSADDVLGSRAVWDGTNDRGDVITSGVYIYQIITQDGLTKVGKVAVIHP